MKLNAYTIGGIGAGALGVVLFCVAASGVDILSGVFGGEAGLFNLPFLLEGLVWMAFALPLVGFLYLTRRLHWWSALVLLAGSFLGYYAGTSIGLNLYEHGLFIAGAAAGVGGGLVVFLSLLPLDPRLRARWRLALYAGALVALGLAGGIGLLVFPTFGWIGLAYAPWQVVLSVTLVVAFESVHRPGVI